MNNSGTLDDVPPGQVPTNTTPTINASSNPKIFDNKNAIRGIIRNCANVPFKTSNGLFKTNLKSSKLKVIPIPNIMTPNKILITDWPNTTDVTQLNTSGLIKPTVIKRIIIMPKYLEITLAIPLIKTPSFYNPFLFSWYL